MQNGGCGRAWRQFNSAGQRLRGYTLIELVIVMVIIGVLAAFALPRFGRLQHEAYAAQVDGAVGALRAASVTVAAQARARNVSNGSLTVEGQSVSIVGGYPEAVWAGAMRGILTISSAASETPVATRCDGQPYCVAGGLTTLPGVGAVSGQAFAVWPQHFQLSDLCYAYYLNPHDGTAATVAGLTSGC